MGTRKVPDKPCMLLAGLHCNATLACMHCSKLSFQTCMSSSPALWSGQVWSTQLSLLASLQVAPHVMGLVSTQLMCTDALQLLLAACQSTLQLLLPMHSCRSLALHAAGQGHLDQAKIVVAAVLCSNLATWLGLQGQADSALCWHGVQGHSQFDAV